MDSDGLPVKVYDGDPADVVFLRSLLVSAAIEVVTAGIFFGPAREIYVRRRDATAARQVLADFEVERSARRASPGGRVE